MNAVDLVHPAADESKHSMNAVITSVGIDVPAAGPQKREWDHEMTA